MIELDRILKFALNHKSPFVRKPVGIAAKFARPIVLNNVANCSPILCNSIPKSGTHALLQILCLLPHQYVGSVIASLTSSTKFRRQPVQTVMRQLEGLYNGEIATGHIEYEESVDQQISELGILNYFIYRDPRDVAVSEVFYLDKMNPWHKLHPYFKSRSSFEEKLLLAIHGLDNSELDYPDIGTRFERYLPWITSKSVCSVRYEDLIHHRESTIRKIFSWAENFDDVETSDALVSQAMSFRPSASHTFRKGMVSAWKDEFTPAAATAIKSVAGGVLVELGYERDEKW